MVTVVTFRKVICNRQQLKVTLVYAMMVQLFSLQNFTHCCCHTLKKRVRELSNLQNAACWTRAAFLNESSNLPSDLLLGSV